MRSVGWAQIGPFLFDWSSPEVQNVEGTPALPHDALPGPGGVDRPDGPGGRGSGPSGRSRPGSGRVPDSDLPEGSLRPGRLLENAGTSRLRDPERRSISEAPGRSFGG